jgi:LmbE family N-acetylglucosaminyl deacetylase
MARKKILVIAPHMDDEALGCGGVIAKHCAQRDLVYVCFVAHRVYGHRFDQSANRIQKEHALRARLVLGYKEAVFLNLGDERLDACLQDMIIPLENYAQKLKPDTVYCPFRQDNNQDHRAVFDAARVALRPLATSFIQSIFMYEVPSSTEQSPALAELAFLPNYYVDISGHIRQKSEAIKCYKRESRAWPHPRSQKAIKVLAQKRGIEIGFSYAEAFMVLREKQR